MICRNFQILLNLLNVGITNLDKKRDCRAPPRRAARRKRRSRRPPLLRQRRPAPPLRPGPRPARAVPPTALSVGAARSVHPPPRPSRPARSVLPAAVGGRARLPGGVGRRPRELGLAKLARFCILQIFAKFKICKLLQILAGSFSAVSKRNIARKYAFESIL